MHRLSDTACPTVDEGWSTLFGSHYGLSGTPKQCQLGEEGPPLCTFYQAEGGPSLVGPGRHEWNFTGFDPAFPYAFWLIGLVTTTDASVIMSYDVEFGNNIDVYPPDTLFSTAFWIFVAISVSYYVSSPEEGRMESSVQRAVVLPPPLPSYRFRRALVVIPDWEGTLPHDDLCADDDLCLLGVFGVAGINE